MCIDATSPSCIMYIRFPCFCAVQYVFFCVLQLTTLIGKCHVDSL